METRPGTPDSGDSPVRVLIINKDLPKFGSRFHEFINTTTLAHHAEVGLVTQLNRPDDAAHVVTLRDHGVAVFTVGPFGGGEPGPTAVPAGRRQRLLRALRPLLLALYRVLCLARPYPEDVYFARRTLRNLAPAILEALSDRSWTHIAIVQSDCAEWIEYLPAHLPTVLVLHDIRALVFQRRAAVADRLVAKAKAWLEGLKYRHFEKRFLQRFTQVICVSETDADLVRHLYGVETVAAVPIPVDATYFRRSPLPAGPENPVILFPGMMNHPPNIDAAIWFGTHAFPALRQRYPEARLVVAGSDPTPAVLALAEQPGVTVTGTVPDMRPHFAEATVVVVPLRYGSGARNKILEAWSVGRPIVSTRIGAEGLAVVDGANVFLADTAEAFVQQISRLVDDTALQDRLVAGGTDAVARHTPARIGALFYDTIRRTTHTAPSRLCIDMRWMVPGTAGGIEQTARAFLRTLLHLDRHNAYTLIVPAETRWSLGTQGNPRVRLLSLNGAGADAAFAWRVLQRRLQGLVGVDYWKSDQVLRLRQLHGIGAGVAYSFTGYIHPDLWPLRHVLLVPDIQHEYHPEFFTPAEVEERRRLFGASVRHATHICAISDFTRQTLIEKLGVLADRISVTHLAADPSFATPPSASRRAAVLTKHGLSERAYLYFPAHTWKHKNHAVLLRALAILRDRHGVTVPLVLSGGRSTAQGDLEALIATLRLEPQVRMLGYIDRADIPSLYAGAEALVFPSLFEGFGMPVLEAMASGCPVLSSSRTCLPEIVGEAAILLDPLDPDAWAAAIMALRTTPGLRDRLITAGFARARLFSWTNFCIATLAVLSDAASEKVARPVLDHRESA